jgi:hypothetical protein
MPRKTRPGIAQPAQPAGGPAGPVLELLNKILDFLFAKLGSLPRSLRPLAYFVFLAFFCATAWRLVAGQYVVHGVMWRDKVYARGCEVRIRTDYFSTNSKGIYYAVLSPMQYYRYVATGGTELPANCPDESADDGSGNGQKKQVDGIPEQRYTVTLSLWDDEFSEIHLKSPAAVPVPSPSKEAGGFSLIASAYADETPKLAQKAPVPLRQAPPPPEAFLPSRGDRLVVNQITRGKSARHIKKAEFEIELGDDDSPLLLQGAEAGRLPLQSTVIFGERYYFDVPRSLRGTVVSIEMEAPGLFGDQERFKFQLPKQPNTAFKVQGSRGSVLELRLLPRVSNAPS